MPIGMPRGYDLSIRVTPITRSWIRTQRLNATRLADASERSRMDDLRQQQLAADRSKAEALPLRSFRTSLKIGSRSNCGMVIDVREPMVQVHLPPHVNGPAGIREFWAPRDELTNAAAPTGCRFGA